MPTIHTPKVRYRQITDLEAKFPTSCWVVCEDCGVIVADQRAHTCLHSYWSLVCEECGVIVADQRAHTRLHSYWSLFYLPDALTGGAVIEDGPDQRGEKSDL